MNFGAPIFAWAALALLPLAAVYFIRTRPRRQPVNAFFLWEKVLEQRTASSLFQRLRNLLSLLLMALAFAAAVLALMKPEFGDNEQPDLVVVLDRSVSMRGGDRFEEARDQVRGWIAAMGGGQRMALATADTRLEYLVSLTDKRRPLGDALDAVEPSDLPLGERVLGELGLVGGREGDRVRILFVTDGRSAAGAIPAGVEVVRVGDDETGNAGITAADLRWSRPGEARLFVTVASTFPEAKEVELELTDPQGVRVARLFSMNLEPEAETSEALDVEGVDPGPWVLRMMVEDDLTYDNEVPLGLNAPQAVPVRVSSPNPFFFEQVVAAFARADSMFEPMEDFAQLGLAEGMSPETDVSVVFAPAGDSPFWAELGEELSPGAPEVLIEDHPLVARIDPALLDFEGARKLRAPEGAVVVLAHPDGTPLLYQARADGRNAVVVNLDPGRGGFFLSPWFPVMVHDATALLTGREDDFPSAVATGGIVVIPGTGPVDAASLDGAVMTAGPRMTVARKGNYEISRSGTRWWFGGGVLSPGESGKPAGTMTGAAAIPRGGAPLAVWLLVAALVAVAVEEMLYHRRKVG